MVLPSCSALQLSMCVWERVTCMNVLGKVLHNASGNKSIVSLNKENSNSRSAIPPTGSLRYYQQIAEQLSHTDKYLHQLSALLFSITGYIVYTVTTVLMQIYKICISTVLRKNVPEKRILLSVICNFQIFLWVSEYLCLSFWLRGNLVF